MQEFVPYGRARGEELEIGGRRFYCRSQVEVRFARILEQLKEAGAIVTWDYEPKDFWFEDIRRGTCSYRPDFRVVWADEGEIWYETKSAGGLRQKDVTKYRRMAKRYPQIRLVLLLSRPLSQGCSRAAVRQRILLDNARKYLDHITYLTDWPVS